MYGYRIFLPALLACALAACGGGSGSPGASSVSAAASSVEQSSSLQASSSVAVSSASQSSLPAADGIWNVYDGSYTPFANGAIRLADGSESQFSLGGNDGGQDAVYFNAVGNGTVNFDSTANAGHHHYGVIENIAPNEGVYPKTFTLIAGITGPSDSNRVIDFEMALADVGADGVRIKAIVRADGGNTGVQLERIVPETDTSADSRQHYGLEMLDVFRVYHFAVELTSPTQGSIRVYLDGHAEPSLSVVDESLRRTASPGQNYLRVGDMGGSGYKANIDWLIWTDKAAYSPAELHNQLPDYIGCIKGYGVAENHPACEDSGDQEEPVYRFDLSYWKITLPDGSERNVQWMLDGGTSTDEFFYTAEGAMVFRCPNIAGTTTNTSYSRTELREMLRATNNSIGTQGFTRNNWVLSTSSPEIQAQVGGIDGNMKATLSVDHVSTTGESGKVGRVIIGQIHGSDDEPVRLYYRKLPGNTLGAFYFAHETRGGSDTWYEMIGSRSNSAANPTDGIALGERFSYEIDVQGLSLTVTVRREGKADISRTITMDSNYTDDWMYFKAGVYNQNDSGLASDYVQATFYELEVSHNSPPSGR